MKINKYIKVRFLLPMLVLVVLSGCEREISDEAVPAKFATTGDIFTDNFVGMGEDFYKPFLGSRFDAFSVDNNEGFESRASYRVCSRYRNRPGYHCFCGFIPRIFMPNYF